MLPEHLTRIMENLHTLVQGYTRNERLADQINASIRKTSFKLYVLKRNNMFTDRELELFNELSECLDSLVKLFVKLYENFTVLNRYSFIRNCQKCQKFLHDIIANRQTQQSHERIDFIFNQLSNAEFLKYVFDSKSAFNHGIVKDMIVDMGMFINQTLI